MAAATRLPSSGQALIDMITAIVEPTSWDDVGGPGSITGASMCGVDMLVVSQTQEVHAQIGRLLEKLREFVRGNRPAAALGDKPADKPVDKPAAAPADDPLGDKPAGEPTEEPASRPPDDPFAEAPPTASR